MGSTNDLKDRLKKHNEGKVFSTKRYKPWKLVYYEAYNDEKLARMREQKIKHHGNAWKQLKQRIIKEVKNGAGFTFIEAILYVAIVSIMLTALIPFAWNIVEGGSKSSVQQEVSSNGRFISERIKYEIRNASGINTGVGETDCASASKVISLSNSNPSLDPTVITYDNINYKVTIRQGTGVTDDLNSSDVKVTNFSCSNNTSGDNKTKNISFSFTVSQAYTGSRQDFKSSMTVQGSAEVRTN